MFQPQTFLNLSTGFQDYVMTPWEILILESFLTDEYFQDMIPFNTSDYIHETNYDTAEPYETQGLGAITTLVSLEEQERMVRKLPKDVRQRWLMADCFAKTGDKEMWVEGNNRNVWKRSFPTKTRELAFKSSSAVCTFAVAVNVWYMVHGTPKAMEEVKEDLWKAYSNYLPTWKGSIVQLLGVHPLKKQMLRAADLQTVIASEDYFLTDLDLWALATYWNIPIVLFNSGTLKLIAGKVGFKNTTTAEASAGYERSWLFMGSKYDSERGVDTFDAVYGPVWFIRSPLSMDKQSGLPAYSLIEAAFSLGELKEIGQSILNHVEAQPFSANVMSLQRFLQSVVPALRATAAATSRQRAKEIEE